MCGGDNSDLINSHRWWSEIAVDGMSIHVYGSGS